MSRKSSDDSAFSACDVCGKSVPTAELTPRRVLHGGVRSALRANPDLSTGGNQNLGVCSACVRQARHTYLASRLVAERGELSALEGEIARKAADHAAIAVHIEASFTRDATRGQRIADAVARIGGSWGFVIPFCAAIAFWIALNTWLLHRDAFDPFPYILLNLALSCVAALQAPIIMMSQNRVSARDRLQADEDFRINLKAELEIASLHEKLDHLLHTRWENLLQVQEEQVALLRELLGSSAPTK